MKILAQSADGVDVLVGAILGECPNAAARKLDMAGECTYRYAGANAVPGQILSKSTVCRIIRDTAVTSSKAKIDPGKGVVHVQIDEKYISMVGKKNKTRYITATIYAGKKMASGKNALTNRTLISGVKIADVAAKINAALSEAYGLSSGSSVYLSGDLAGYIQNFPERLMCKATYVPDKWHVCRFLSSKGSPVKADEVLKKLQSIDEAGDITGLSKDAAKVYRLWKRSPKIFDPWGKDDYLGCCQEAMNSHYYAPRFGKYANRFKETTVAMLSMVREARENGWELKISSKSLREEGASLLATLGRPYEAVMKYDIDTREMDYATRKMFARIEYPDICLSGLR